MHMYMMRKLSNSDDLIEQYSPLVHRIAYHLKARLPANVLVDDLIQVGMIGLLDASQHYDPSQGASFETYATIRVRGSMLDELRRNDWAPKSVHRKARELLEIVQKLETELGREAKPAEIAERMQISLDDYFQLVQESNATRILNFVDLGVEGEINEYHDVPQNSEPLHGLQNEQFKEHLVSAITALPEREKLVVSLYYDEEFNLREIGEILGVSESRISQLLSQAHTRMRGYMSEYLQA